MSTADAAARLIERLLAEPDVRAAFRRNPAAVCRACELDELADELAGQPGQALMTLDIRESRSSLAGVMMAAALEGFGIYELVEHVGPAFAQAPDHVHDVLSRVNLPALDSLKGALSAAPAEAATGGGGGGGASSPSAVLPAAPAQPPAAAPPPPEPAGGGGGGGGSRSASLGLKAVAPDKNGSAGGHAPKVDDAAKADNAPKVDDAPKAHRDAPAPDDAPKAHRDAPEARAATTTPDPAPAAGAHHPIDPGQFGQVGTGGDPDAEAQALLHNKNITLDADGITDIKQGRIDPRIVAVLTKLSEKHKISISCMSRDHPFNTAGGSVSNHTYGRGMDIASVDGVPVNASNIEARDIATQLNELDPKYRPTEIGSPWSMGPSPPYFSDADHTDHVHVGFDDPIDPSWTPPAEVAAGGSGGSDAVARTAETGGGSGGGRAPRDTLSLVVPGSRAGHSTMSAITVPDDARPAAAEHNGRAAQLADVTDGKGGDHAGAKALAAVKEAKKYLGTPYFWTGSSPKTGFDCSGLMQWAYAQQGIQISRTTYTQIAAENGTAVTRNHLLPGDLVFFADGGDVHHVGMSLGGDKFLHAPHTGDVVKISSLDEPYYKSQFAGGRRFVHAGEGAAPHADDVRDAQAAHAQDAAASRSSDTLMFKALQKQESVKRRSTVQFMRAVTPQDLEAVASAHHGPTHYPGDHASKAKLAAWMGQQAEKAGLPRELPVMAGLVESGLSNVQGGDRDSVGFFQMRVGTWNQGPYTGYMTKPELQMKWFIDQAVAVKQRRVAAGDTAFLKDPKQWGNWVADVELCQEDLRYKYQDQLEAAQALLH